MLDNPALKPWLIKHLEPICQADPAVLTQYIQALLQHNLPREELQALCLSQLHDFLAQQTAPFVAALFEFLAKPSPFSIQLPPTPTAPRAFKRPLSEPSLPPSKGPRSSQVPSRGTSLVGSMLNQNYQHPARHPDLWPVSRPGKSALLHPVPPCQDYHYRGFCARGESCPYQHSDSALPLRSTSIWPERPSALVDLSVGRPLQVPVSIVSPPSVSPQHPPTHGSAIASGSHLLPPNGSRLGVQSQQSQMSLVIENIPPASLNTGSIHRYFSKFGPVVDVGLDISKRRAHVWFVAPDQVKQALSSPEAVFGNRFVRVRRPRPDDAFHTPSLASPSLLTQHAMASTAATPSPPSSVLPLSSAPVNSPSNNVTSRAFRLTQNASEQKRLLEQLEATPRPDSAERAAIMGSLRKWVADAASLSANSSMLPVVWSATTASSPAEVELPEKREDEGPQEQLARLQKEAEELGIDIRPKQSFASRGRGRGQVLSPVYHSSSRDRAVGRVSAPWTSFKLDNRTRKILLSDISSFESISSLREYLESFGELVSLAHTGFGTDHLVEFQSRHAAEQALSRGVVISGVGRISMKWERSRSLGTQSNFTSRSVTQGEVVENVVAEDDDPEPSWNRS